MTTPSSPTVTDRACATLVQMGGERPVSAERAVTGSARALRKASVPCAPRYVPTRHHEERRVRLANFSVQLTPPGFGPPAEPARSNTSVAASR
jgi:hypothetical protein